MPFILEARHQRLVMSRKVFVSIDIKRKTKCTWMQIKYSEVQSGSGMKILISELNECAAVLLTFPLFKRIYSNINENRPNCIEIF